MGHKAPFRQSTGTRSRPDAPSVGTEQSIDISRMTENNSRSRNTRTRDKEYGRVSAESGITANSIRASSCPLHRESIEPSVPLPHLAA